MDTPTQPTDNQKRIGQYDIIPGAVKQRACEAWLTFSGLDADLPTGKTEAKMYYATDTNKLYIWDVDVWRVIGYTGDIAGGNYTSFESDGTLVMTGNATVWDDLAPTPVTSAKLGATAPTLATFVTDIEQYTFDATNDYIIGATEITHKWKEGTTIYPHVHWASNGLDATARGVQWRLKYTIGDSMEVFSSQSTTVVDATIPASTTDRTHFITDFNTPITGTGYRIGAYICWRFERIATAHANGAPTSDPFALAVGFHVEMDTIGSRLITSK